MNSIELIVLALVFTMTLVVTLRAMESLTLFGPIGSKVVSVCVSLLSVIGLRQALDCSLDGLLLPYAVLGIMALLYCLLALKQWCLKRSERFCEHILDLRSKKNRRYERESHKFHLRKK